MIVRCTKQLAIRHKIRSIRMRNLSVAPTATREERRAFSGVAARIPTVQAHDFHRQRIHKIGLAISLFLNNAKASEKDRLTRQMTGGILRRIEEITIFLNPIANSYERIGTFEAPAAVNYGLGNGNFLIKAHPEAARVKVKSADPSCNPYLACLLLAGAAMEGIRDDVNPDDYNTGHELPDTLNDAIKCAEKSDFTRTMIPDILFEKFLQAKRDDWMESSLSGDPMLKAKNMEFPVT